MACSFELIAESRELYLYMLHGDYEYSLRVYEDYIFF